MFGDAASDLLKMMGQSGNVPGAIMGEDVAEALASLRKQLDEQADEVEQGEADLSGDDEEDRTSRVGLATRAVPLMELLTAAADAKANVMWDS